MSGREPLAAEALVVRCGLPPFSQGVGPTILRERCVLHEGVYGFSVQSASGVTFERLAAVCPNRKVGVLTVAEIRELGYDVVVTAGRGHHATVVVPPDWDHPAAEALARAFRVRENPMPGGRR